MSGDGNGRQARLLTADEWKLVAPRRLRAVDAAPYFASLLLAMPVYAVDGITAAVDRSARLYLGMEYFAGLSDDEAVGLLLHEVQHVVHGHGERCDARGVTGSERQVWNVAADLTINDDLRDGGFELPDGGVSCEELQVARGLAAETYFEQLRGDRPDAPPLPPAECGSGAGGEGGEWEFPDAEQSDDRGGDDDGLGRGLSPLDLDLQRRQVAGEVANHVARHGRGTVPTSLQRWAEEVLAPPTVSWREVLRTAVRRPLQVVAGVDDYTWTRPNRRRRSGSVILPSTMSRVPSVAIVVDTSGSVEAGALSAFVAEIVAMVGQFRVQARDVPVIACDSVAHPAVPADRVASGAELASGGGTDMGAGITAAASLRPRPDLVVVFTDGHTPWPNTAPGMAVVVALASKRAPTPPTWATTVHVDEA